MQVSEIGICPQRTLQNDQEWPHLFYRGEQANEKHVVTLDPENIVSKYQASSIANIPSFSIIIIPCRSLVIPSFI